MVSHLLVKVLVSILSSSSLPQGFGDIGVKSGQDSLHFGQILQVLLALRTFLRQFFAARHGGLATYRRG